ncbi:hypothetical protein BGZ65_007023 [Modicella reniformis]|uniref:Uncharacterized protein n=1 Tax=Modicella reniformis TaxID=1440133 RepID=A0A9P6MFJ5_9FUNG|nr:hypothetical protein BGZ65_007023 [Modicella reniformis]
MDQFQEHLNYYRKQSDPTVQIPQRLIHIPHSNRITAGQINDISYSNRMGVRRERRLKKDGSKDVREALATISTNDHSLARAATKKEIDIAHQARSQTRGLLRSFETSRGRLKDLQTQRLRAGRAWTKAGAVERERVLNHGLKTPPCKNIAGIPTASSVTTIVTTIITTIVTNSNHIKDRWILHTMPKAPRCDSTRKQTFCTPTLCPKAKPDIIPVMLVGDAGTGVGSRIKEHARRGGKKLRQEHMKHCPVILTDECKAVEGALVRVHGALECVNSPSKSGKRSSPEMHK